MEHIELYRQMVRARAFELSLHDLWHRGLISGELHLGTGEEAIVAGVMAHHEDGDALALDHRCTPVLTLLGVDMALMLKKMLGSEGGLCRGRAGHMHLCSRDHLAAASGIVGAAAPLGAGFALAAKLLRPGSAALAFFGEGALNQGMLMESLNLASAWSLPLVFVCKDNSWAITTPSQSVTGGDLLERGRSFGIPTNRVDGTDVLAVQKASGEAFARARDGEGPSVLIATCPRLDGHFLGDPMLQLADRPFTKGGEDLRKVFSSVLSRKGARAAERLASLRQVTGLFLSVRGTQRDKQGDPLVRTRKELKKGHAKELDRIESDAQEEVRAVCARVLEANQYGFDTLR